MSKDLEEKIDLRRPLPIRPWLLLTLVLWLCSCDYQLNSTAPEEASEAPESALIEDGFYGQNTTLDDEHLDTEKGERTTELELDSDSAHSVINENSRINGNKKASSDSEKIVANIGFSQSQEEAPLEAAEQASSFTCITDMAPTSLPELSDHLICQRISKRLASVSMESCQSANLEPSQCASVNRFPILFTEFLPLNERKPLGRILVVGGTHGDELTSVSIVFRWIAKLNKFHSGLFHWRLAPMLNPDGVLKKAATRTNQNGVDLNRNMPSDDWEENAIKYWTEKSNKNKRRYPGPEAASEPETRWLIDQINTFKPDAIISVHAPYGVVDYDALILNTAPKNLGKLALNLLGTYPGSLGNYAGINLDIPVITLELPHAWEMPSEQESTKIWEDIVTWLRKNVNNPELANN